MKLNKSMFLKIIIVLIVVIILVFLALHFINKKDDNSYVEGPNENSMANDYGFTKEDAIEIVKVSYNSDNYEFSVSANDNNQYIVVVTNILNNEKTTFIVNPNTKEATILE